MTSTPVVGATIRLTKWVAGLSSGTPLTVVEGDPGEYDLYAVHVGPKDQSVPIPLRSGEYEIA